MLPYLAEFLGTMMLIMLGDGVCANVNLSKSGMKGGGTVQITMAWAAAVMIPAFIFGAASGASFNPALTIALAADGSFAWNMVPGYVIAQIAGGFVGAWIVWLTFKKQFRCRRRRSNNLGVFSTRSFYPKHRMEHCIRGSCNIRISIRNQRYGSGWRYERTSW